LAALTALVDVGNTTPRQCCKRVGAVKWRIGIHEVTVGPRE
jgi:hypothetical protein